ncbi:MAG: UDP-N-acetylmuramate dehydrogenase [Oscillospiraceae bacterium]|nr:UDP-N-acetylmuramate dehydrogenase [Oscillospiraceae bacterium]
MRKYGPLISDIRRSVSGVRVLEGVHMSEHTSFRIGGEAPVMFVPEEPEALAELCSALNDRGVRPFITGNGTNLLIEDGDLGFPVVKTVSGNDIARISGDAEVTAPAGMLLSRLAVFAQQNGLTGLEFAHGIPGTLGGAVSMDAGAYGGEMKDVVTSTLAFSPERGVYEIRGEEHDFSYRHSVFSDTDSVILSSAIRLEPGNASAVKARMDELAEKRRASQPLDMPSAGSTFKRPKGGYAAAMIDGAGLKGCSVGGAQVSTKHAGFIVNTGGATFDDVIRLIEIVQERVLREYGAELEPEVKIIRRSWGAD